MYILKNCVKKLFIRVYTTLILRVNKTSGKNAIKAILEIISIILNIISRAQSALYNSNIFFASLQIRRALIVWLFRSILCKQSRKVKESRKVCETVNSASAIKARLLILPLPFHHIVYFTLLFFSLLRKAFSFLLLPFCRQDWRTLTLIFKSNNITYILLRIYYNHIRSIVDRSFWSFIPHECLNAPHKWIERLFLAYQIENVGIKFLKKNLRSLKTNKN